MLALLVLLPLAVFDDAKEPTKETEVIPVTPDGGQVPTIAPGLTDNLAPVLAPELKPDGGTPIVVTDPTLSVYDINLPVEASVTAASLGLFVFVDFLIKPSLEGDVSCRRPVGNGRCNPADLTAFDRYAVGRNSEAWGTFSDVALFTSLAVPFIYLGLESIVLPTHSPWGDFAGDLLVIAESMAVTTALQMVLKFAVRRPRPIRYTDLEEPLTEFDAELSFPSGHTSLVAAATTALSTTVFLRHPDSPARWVVLGLGLSLTGLTAFSRVEAGAHFPTDVIVGMFVGGFAGFVVPWLHHKKFDVPVTPTASFNPVNGSSTVGLTGRF